MAWDSTGVDDRIRGTVKNVDLSKVRVRIEQNAISVPEEIGNHYGNIHQDGTWDRWVLRRVHVMALLLDSTYTRRAFWFDELPLDPGVLAWDESPRLSGLDPGR